jgi:hypothetical protein
MIFIWKTDINSPPSRTNILLQKHQSKAMQQFLFHLLLFVLITITNAQGNLCPPVTINQTPTLTTPFAIKVINASYPEIDQRLMNFWKAGGGDNHLYLSPAGDPVSNHTLVSGVLTNTESTWGPPQGVRICAVINGEV